MCRQFKSCQCLLFPSRGSKRYFYMNSSYKIPNCENFSLLEDHGTYSAFLLYYVQFRQLAANNMYFNFQYSGPSYLDSVLLEYPIAKKICKRIGISCTQDLYIFQTHNPNSRTVTNSFFSYRLLTLSNGA